MTTARVSGLVAAWLAAAALIVGSGALGGLRPPAPQAVILGLSLAGWLAMRRVSPLRAWSDTADVRVLASPHLARALAGVLFLRASAAGQLPGEFALPAAWGDIAVAVVAALLLLNGPVRSRAHARAWMVWNVFGLIDIMLVVANAARVWVPRPETMAAMLRLPLGLLPTFLVPIVFITHALLFARLGATGRRPAG